MCLPCSRSVVRVCFLVSKCLWILLTGCTTESAVLGKHVVDLVRFCYWLASQINQLVHFRSSGCNARRRGKWQVVSDDGDAFFEVVTAEDWAALQGFHAGGQPLRCVLR